MSLSDSSIGTVVASRLAVWPALSQPDRVLTPATNIHGNSIVTYRVCSNVGSVGDNHVYTIRNEHEEHEDFFVALKMPRAVVNVESWRGKEGFEKLHTHDQDSYANQHSSSTSFKCLYVSVRSIPCSR